MKLSRPSRLIAAFIALVSMLFMQLAVAAYACPGMMTGNVNRGINGATAGAAAPAMMNCEGMDMEQPALCHAHSQDSFSKQSLDKPQLPDVQPFVSAGLVLALDIADIAFLPQPPHRDPVSLARSTAPPIAIRNCCFRI
ncbi:MAG: hypothetical protein V4634_00560 [Pseudomonadota bacterium]